MSMVNDWEAQFCRLFYVVSHNASEDCSTVQQWRLLAYLQYLPYISLICKTQDLQSSSHLGHNQMSTLHCIYDVDFLNCSTY